jgi:Protein of unknown function (DUF3108)
MIKLFTCLCIGLLGWQVANGQVITSNFKSNDIFDFGEELTYKATFLGMTAGKATTRVDQTHHKILGKTCYKIDVIGETSDWISWVTRVKDTWGAYIDTTNFLTRATYRNIREGKYKKDEWVTFDQDAHKASVQVIDKKTNQYKPAKVYPLAVNATDIVGGFMQLRFFDLDHMRKGDTLSIVGFFDDANYPLKIAYMGKEIVKTKVGKIPCHVLTPKMPKNELFDGTNSISVWISDDRNKIPVKFSAKMFVGHTGIELTGFKGLKHGLRLVF